jgi:hypothetical protein
VKVAHESVIRHGKLPANKNIYISFSCCVRQSRLVKIDLVTFILGEALCRMVNIDQRFGEMKKPSSE